MDLSQSDQFGHSSQSLANSSQFSASLGSGTGSGTGVNDPHRQMVARLVREDFCYKEYPLSIGFHVYQLRLIVVTSFAWIMVVSIFMILFGISFLLHESETSKIVAEFEIGGIDSQVARNLFFPSTIVSNQLDLAIRTGFLNGPDDQKTLSGLFHATPEQTAQKFEEFSSGSSSLISSTTASSSGSPIIPGTSQGDIGKSVPTTSITSSGSTATSSSASSSIASAVLVEGSSSSTTMASSSVYSSSASSNYWFDTYDDETSYNSPLIDGKIIHAKDLNLIKPLDLFEAMQDFEDMRLVFSTEEYGYFSHKKTGLQSDNNQCAELGDFSCLPIKMKTPSAWYKQGMSLFPPSIQKMFTYCEWVSPEMIPRNNNVQPLIAALPSPTFTWSFGWSRVCKHEFTASQSTTDDRVFAISKTAISMDSFLSWLKAKESVLKGRVYLLRYAIGNTRIAGITDKAAGTTLDGAVLKPTIITPDLMDITTDDSAMTLMQPGEYSSIGQSHVLVRPIKDTQDGYVFLTLVPYYAFSSPPMFGLIIFILVIAIFPFFVMILIRIVYSYWRGRKVQVKHQTFDEVVKKNIQLHSQYIPATSAERERLTVRKSMAAG